MFMTKTKDACRPQFERSAETEALVAAIEQLNAAEASYAALSSIVGFRVFGAHPALRQARKVLEREREQVWAIRTEWGIFLASTSNVIDLNAKDNAGGRRKFGRSRKRGRRISDAQFTALPPAVQTKHLLTQAEAEAKAIGTRRKIPEKTFKAVTAGTLDIKAAIAALKK